MKIENFFAELKRRNVYKVAAGVCCCRMAANLGRDASLLFEIACVFVCVDHVASRIINANHSIM